MKLRASHIVVALIVLIGAFILFAMNYKPAASGAGEVEDFVANPMASRGLDADEALLRKAREDAEKIPMGDGVGNVAPVGVDDNFVPIIEVETDEFDMGLISNAEPTSKPLKVFNRGKLPLKIYNIETSCACTQGEIPEAQSVIPVGGEGIVTVTVDPYRIPGFVSDKVLTISSNDPNQTQVKVTVHADVDPEFVLEPAVFDFGKVNKGESPALTVRFRQLQDAPINITEVNSFGQLAPSEAADELQLSFEPVPEDQWAEPDKREYDIHAQLAPDAPVGTLYRRVFLVSDLPRVVAMNIPTRAEVVAPYALDPVPPKQVVIKGTEGAVGTATVTAESAVSIENVQVPEGILVATVRPQESPDTVRIDLSVDNAAPAGAIQETVSFDVVMGDARYTESVNVRSFKM